MEILDWIICFLFSVGLVIFVRYIAIGFGALGYRLSSGGVMLMILIICLGAFSIYNFIAS